MKRVLSRLLLSLLPALVYAADVVTEESLRGEVLAAVFPRMKIQLEAGVAIDNGSRSPSSGDLSFPDALAAEKVYHVLGPYGDDVERCAAENMQTERLSETREVRMRMYTWPGASGKSDLLGVLQYKFLNAAPAGSCWSIARLLHLTRNESGWGVTASILLDTMHHTGIQRIQVVDLNGDGMDELVIETDSGGAGTVASDLIVFALRSDGFEQWLSVPSRLFVSIDEIQQFVQVLDVLRTARKGAQQFCFTKTVLAAHDKWLQNPLRTQPCYPRYTGTNRSSPQSAR